MVYLREHKHDCVSASRNEGRTPTELLSLHKSWTLHGELEYFVHISTSSNNPINGNNLQVKEITFFLKSMLSSLHTTQGQSSLFLSFFLRFGSFNYTQL